MMEPQADPRSDELILNVDDHEPARYAKTRILRRAGYEVIEAGTGLEALELVRSRRPDLVLLDVMLPDINGYEVCKRIREDPAVALTAVLQTSASFVDLQSRVRALEEGADNYLTAPFEPEVLVSSVRALLRMRRAERQLGAARKAFRATFEQAPVAIGHVALDGAWLRVNDRLSALLGVDRSKPSGNLNDCLDAASRIRFGAGTRGLLGGGQPSFCFDLRVLAADGAERDLALTASLVGDGDEGSLPYLIVLLEDITDRVRAETVLQKHQDELRESEERFRQFAENSRDVVWIFDTSEQRLEYVSAAFEEVWRLDPGLVLEQPRLWIESVAEEDREGLLASLERARGGETTAVEYRIVRPDGERRWIDHRSFPVRDAMDRIHRIAGVAQDVTDRKRLEEQGRQLLESERAARTEAERANHLKDQFVATLGHELRTPLNAVLGWAELLCSGRRTEAEYQEGLAVIQRNARAQALLIGDLLDVSRIATGKIVLELERVDLGQVVESVVETARQAARAKDVELHSRVGRIRGGVSGDPTRLEQIVSNLVSNALKFTPAGGRVEVELAERGNSAELTVRDSGIGIAPKFLPHLFERFRQADPTFTRRHGGLGLGLSIVRSLTELHGGRVTAASAGKDRGATFVVELPIDRTVTSSAPSASGPGSEVSAITLPGLRIFLVEDEPDALEFLRRLLADRDAIVQGARSAREAIAAIAGFAPDVVVSDIGLPEMDGYELLRVLREQPGVPPFRAIALTAFAREEDRTRTLAAGFDRHVSKPLRPHDLLTALAELARSSELEPRQR